ncbi:MAG: AAA family ATPase [Bacteroidetes bacterium]|nr:AAA family ATPase [Bacteroidota bacterium]MCY4204425.1 AAA family ATPase [Bacteroidota bacterium]
MTQDTSQESQFDLHTSHYPEWARLLARKYFTKTLIQFILHGNVRDLVRLEDFESGQVDYVGLTHFLAHELFAARDIVVFYDRAAGIHFLDAETKKDFNRALSGHDSLFGTEFARKRPRNPSQVLAILDNYFRLRLASGKRIACIIDYAETIIPMAEASMYSAEDRSAIVNLQRWAHDPLFLQHDFTICLITENLSDLNQQHVQSPWTSEIYIPLPEKDDRFAFAQWSTRDSSTLFNEHSDLTLEEFSQNTPGLGYTQLRTILADTLENKTHLSFKHLSELKKALIEEAAFGMLEFVESKNGLDDVAGHSEAKLHLRQAASALRQGIHEVMPMGYLVSGPVGTGKTFLITCFANDIGIPMVRLKNFRSQWQGQTEGNLERILNLLEAMPPVAVMIDEADAALGNRDAEGDSGVSKRVFGQIASFMSKPEHRGQIIFFLITARPDLMPVDLKRQGRAEEHLALFYPSTPKDRLELLRVMMRRTKIDLPEESIPTALLNGKTIYSGADMEALLTRAKFRATAINDTSNRVTPEILSSVVEDFIPPANSEEKELQTLVAVLESTSRESLPEIYRSMDRAEIIQRVNVLKLKLS